MTDLKTRFQTLDGLEAPDLWREIESRSAAPQPLPNSRRLLLFAIATVLVITAVGGAALVGSGAIDLPDVPLPPVPQPALTPAPSAIESNTMTATRVGHTSTPLLDGTVLAAGGWVEGGAHLATAERYDPTSDSWTATGSMIFGRAGHTATLLPNGMVLAAGGLVESGTQLASAELFDPGAGSWTATGSMHEGRAGHTATLLPDGRVLVAGGIPDYRPSADGGGSSDFLASAEVFDPATGAWAVAAEMKQARTGHSATLLPDGVVLVAGGYTGGRLDSAELFDPATGTWTATADLPEPFLGHSATLLLNGNVLIAGGDVPSGPGAAGSAHAALYDPVSGRWTLTESMAVGRLNHSATLLPDGRVLVLGGQRDGGESSGVFTTAEAYDPIRGTWRTAVDMEAARAGHSATLLSEGQVLVAGGTDHPSAELYVADGN